jgi:ABC-type transporter Mla MlaB component
MTTLMDWQRIDGERLATVLKEQREKLGEQSGDVMLDFSGVARIDPAGLLAVEELADEAHKKSVKVVLRGVNVGIYKVLKLAGLTSRFSFVN